MPYTKSALIADLAEKAGITKAVAKSVLEGLSEIAAEQLKTEGAFTVPGVAKLKTKATPAKPARQGVNPFTKQPQTFAAKAASTKVKATAVAALKVAVGAKPKPTKRSAAK